MLTITWFIVSGLGYLCGVFLVYHLFHKLIRENRLISLALAIIWPASLIYLIWTQLTSHREGYF